MYHDTSQRFLFEEKDIRGELVSLKASYQAAIEHHPYPLPVAKLLGKALASSALLSMPLKFDGSLILQTKSNGPVGTVVAQCNHLLHLRGIANWEENADLDKPDPDLLGQGHLAITIIPNDKKERYQGIVNMEHDTLATAIETYFYQSEQLPTRIWLAANAHEVRGLLLQQLPHAKHIDPHYFEHITELANTLLEQELLTLDNETLLHRLFHQENVRLFDKTPVCFRCQCSIEKMEQAIITAGKEDMQDLLKTHKVVEVTCEFCKRHYEFDKVDIERIFHD